MDNRELVANQLTNEDLIRILEETVTELKQWHGDRPVTTEGLPVTRLQIFVDVPDSFDTNGTYSIDISHLVEAGGEEG